MQQEERSNASDTLVLTAKAVDATRANDWSEALDFETEEGDPEWRSYEGVS